jgi:hypothetical protein
VTVGEAVDWGVWFFTLLAAATVQVKVTPGASVPKEVEKSLEVPGQ